MPKKEKIQKMFDGIAGDYDRLNHIMSLGIDRSWRRRAIKEIVRKAPAPSASASADTGSRSDPEAAAQEILDIACGTGDFSIAIARAMAPGSRVTGLDLSEGMLAVMRAKLAAAGLEDRVACVQGDSEALPYAGGSSSWNSLSRPTQ